MLSERNYGSGFVSVECLFSSFAMLGEVDLDLNARTKQVDQHSGITSHEILLLIMIHFAY